jgi:opacity protein-like surface antigen
MRSSSGYVQVGAGVRYWAVDTSIYVREASASRSPDWVDFVGGFRGQQYVSDTLYIEGTALAGFGGSEFMWDVYGGLGYNFTSNFSGSIGYRGLGVNYSTGPTDLDLTMHGPVAGLTLRF